jgi:hypothetical protein
MTSPEAPPTAADAAEPTAPSIVELNRPGLLIPVLERAMAQRILPRRSGWSAAHHLRRDLGRHFGVSAPPEAIEAALRVLSQRRRVHLRSDEHGVLWYRLRV